MTKMKQLVSVAQENGAVSKSESDLVACWICSAEGWPSSCSGLITLTTLRAWSNPFSLNLPLILSLVLHKGHLLWLTNQLLTQDSHPTTLWQHGEIIGAVAALLHIPQLRPWASSSRNATFFYFCYFLQDSYSTRVWLCTWIFCTNLFGCRFKIFTHQVNSSLCLVSWIDTNCLPRYLLQRQPRSF